VAERTHYQVLGVRQSAPFAEIRGSYRQLAYRLHPDRQAGVTEAERQLAERRMREVNAAWTTLSDPAKRAAYDRTLVPRGSGASGSGSGTRAGAGSAAGAGASGRPGASDAGSGQWWDADDPDAVLARAKAAEAAEVDALDEEPDLSGVQFWLLRRGVVVAMVIVGLIIFVASAYAGRGATDPTATSAPPAMVADSECVKVMADHMAYNVSCEGSYDARIVREEPNARSCLDDGLEYAVVRARSVCVDEDV